MSHYDVIIAQYNVVKRSVQEKEWRYSFKQ